MPNRIDRPERRVPGQEGEEHERQRLREGPQRELRHGVGVAQRRDPAVRQRRPQDGVDEDIDLGGREAERDGKHQPADLSNTGIIEAEGGARAPAGSPQRRQLDADVQHRTGHHPNGEGGDAVAGREEGGRHDDGAVVEEWSQRLREEALIGGQDADHHAARTQEDRLQQQDPGKADDHLVVVRAVAEGDQRDVEGRDEEEDRRANGQDHDRRVEDPLGDLQGPLVIPLRQVLGQHRDERRADGAGQQQIEQQIRHAERDAVVVDLVARAKGIGDDQLAHGAEHTAQPVSDENKRRGRRDAPPLAGHWVPLSRSTLECETIPSRVGRVRRAALARVG